MDSVSDLKTFPKNQNKQSNTIFDPVPKSPDQVGNLGVIQPRGFPPLPDDWVTESEVFPSSEGSLHLYSVIHHKKDWKTPKVLVVFHGQGEHGGRYLHFPHFVNSVVDAVFCLDHRGHGRSEGLRGHVDRFDLYTDDAALAISRLDAKLKKQFGHSEIYVLGHSMGGLITLRLLLLHPNLPIRSAVISAPLLKIGFPVPQLKKWAAFMISRIWGTLHMNSELNPEYISHDPAVVEAYIEDRLNHYKITPRFFVELLAAMDDTLKRTTGFNLPMQMVIPEGDRIVDSQVSLQFYRDVKLRGKDLKTYPGFYHESFNELKKDQVFHDLVNWIQSSAKGTK